MASVEVDTSPDRDVLMTLESAGGRSEDCLVKLLAGQLQSADLWVEKRYSPWDFDPEARSGRSVELLKGMGHSGQPDIDLLWGPVVDGQKTSPIHVAEVKFFAKTRSSRGVIPKTSGGIGYYAGLDQALALSNYGVDTASLWHVFRLPYERWSKHSDDVFDELSDDYNDWCFRYIDDLCTLITLLQLPIGYQCAGFIIGRDSEDSVLKASLFPIPRFTIAAPINPARDFPGVQPARRRLMSRRGIGVAPAAPASRSSTSVAMSASDAHESGSQA